MTDIAQRVWQQVMADLLLKELSGILKPEVLARWLMNNGHSNNQIAPFLESVQVVTSCIGDPDFTESLNTFLKNLCAYEEIPQKIGVPETFLVTPRGLSGEQLCQELERVGIAVQPEVSDVLRGRTYASRIRESLQGGQTRIAVTPKAFSHGGVSTAVLREKMTGVGFGEYVNLVIFFDFLLQEGTTCFENQTFRCVRPYATVLSYRRFNYYFVLTRQKSGWELGVSRFQQERTGEASPMEARVFGPNK